ncbi:MAG: CoA-acylating methylmalonate-semialdehyde dehydrogenase [Pseudomonadota bacterium]
MANSARSTIGHLINGESLTPKDGAFLDVFNPATGEVSSRLAVADTPTLDRAIRAAQDALPGWAATPPITRARIMQQFLNLLHAHRDDIAALVTAEHGKTLPDAGGSLQRGIENVEFACGVPYLLRGDFHENVGSHIDCYNMRQPVGVCAGITPFNFPAMVPLWMYPLAIACGNTFILKPSEKDPSSALFIANLLHEAGLPKGVLNVVNGDKDVVQGLLTDPRIQAISFVGSTAVGKQIYTTGSAHGKRVQAMCGAKNHLVVMPDADITAATNALMGAAFGSAGERCMAISIAVAIGDEVGDKLVAALTPQIKALKVGDGTKPGMDMGPLITREHLAKVTGYLEKGEAEGATLVIDGRTLAPQGNGFFIGGSLFDHLKPEMSVYQEEIFGPVLGIIRVPSFAAALELVNAHPYGNGASIFTNNGQAARTFTSLCNIGMVGINVPIPVPMAFHSFGGWKQSAFGDHAIYGMEGLHFYTKLKTITARWKPADAAEFTMPVLR